jgi:hypothetical protein
MEWRNISLAEVEAACDHHHTAYDGPDGKPCYVGDVDGRNLKVVVAPDDPELVITAYFQ